MPDFMLCMSGRRDAWSQMSAKDKEEIMKKYFAFVDRLRTEKRYLSGSPLEGGGYSLRAEPSKGIRIEGPFVESKEAFNGYFLFHAESMAEAVAIAKDCPALEHGEVVEVFQLGGH